MKFLLLNNACPILFTIYSALIAAEPSPDNSDDPFGVAGFNTRGNASASKPVKGQRGTFEMQSELLQLNKRLVLAESELKQLKSTALARANKWAEWEGIIATCKKIDAEKKVISENRNMNKSERELKSTELENEKSRYLLASKSWNGDLMDAIKELRNEIEEQNELIDRKSKAVVSMKAKAAVVKKELQETQRQ